MNFNNTLYKVQQLVHNMSNMMHTLLRHISTAEHVRNTLSTTCIPQNTIADERINGYITTNLVLHMLHEQCCNKRGRAPWPTPGAPGPRACTATPPRPTRGGMRMLATRLALPHVVAAHVILVRPSLYRASKQPLNSPRERCSQATRKLATQPETSDASFAEGRARSAAPSRLEAPHQLGRGVSRPSRSV